MVQSGQSAKGLCDFVVHLQCCHLVVKVFYYIFLLLIFGNFLLTTIPVRTRHYQKIHIILAGFTLSKIMCAYVNKLDLKKIIVCCPGCCGDIQKLTFTVVCNERCQLLQILLNQEILKFGQNLMLHPP